MKSERRPNSGVRGAFRRRVTRSLHLIRTIPSTPEFHFDGKPPLAGSPLRAVRGRSSCREFRLLKHPPAPLPSRVPPPAAHFPSAAMLLWVRHLPRSLPSRLHAKGARAAPPPFRERLLRDLYILSPGNQCMTSSGVFQGPSVRAGWVFRTDKALSIGEGRRNHLASAGVRGLQGPLHREAIRDLAGPQDDRIAGAASVNAAAHLCAGHHAAEDAHTGQVSRRHAASQNIHS